MINLTRLWKRGVEKDQIVGRKEEIQEYTKKAALSMLRQELNFKLISLITGLSVSQVIKLKSKI